MDAAMPSITSANDVRVIDASYTSCIVSTSDTGTLPLTDDRRCLIASISAWAAGSRASHQEHHPPQRV